MMNDVAAAEAQDLLSGPLACVDSPGWQLVKMQPGSCFIEVGVLDQKGMNVRLLVQLIFRESPTTHRTTYKFSVFKRQVYGSERVYQLSVEQWPTPIPDAHKHAHEHFGDQRTMIPESWDNWTYEDVLAYFCKRTNISFTPPIPHPKHFALSGGKQ